MVEIVTLGDGEEPQENRYLLIQWKPGQGMRSDYDGGRMVQHVPEHLWPF